MVSLTGTDQTGGPALPARDQRAEALELLEYGTIRRQVADRTSFVPARRLALEMAPADTEGEVADLQREAAEGLAVLERVGDVGLQASADVSPALRRAALDGLLTGPELLGVADSLEVQRRVRAAILKARQFAPVLVSIAERIPEFNELRVRIRSRIGARGDVVDDATPTLRALRVQGRGAYERLTDELNGIIRSSLGREALQDEVVSVRGDRLVLQVKAEMRHRMPGIVHDASNTGATLFVEPFATVDVCNSWRELVLEEEREVARILRELSTEVGDLADEIGLGNDLAARLDFILARARYGAAMKGVRVFPAGPERTVRLIDARHPLLGDGAVPITIGIGPDWSVLVITGPNTGGKTVAMKTVGLLALMYQSGLQLPCAEGSALPIFDGIFADVGDQQSIERSVSTFSSHMLNAIEIIAQAGPRSLVLLDELGSSTDPEEGSALAKAILGHLASRGVPTIATTHHRTVAAYAEGTPGMGNASVQLDPRTLRPTYEVTLGVPGRSYAMSVAAGLGLPREILDEARSLLEPQHLRFEDWLNELQGDRLQLRTRLQEAEVARARAESVRRDLEAQLEYLMSHREDILDSTRRELLSQYEDVRQRLRRAEAALSWTPPPSQATPSQATEATARVAGLRQEIESHTLPPPAPPRRPRGRPIEVGDVVDVRGLNLTGTVASASDQGGEVEVKIGQVRLRIDPGRLSRTDEEPESSRTEIGVALGPALSSSEIDLRGLRAEEAIFQVEDFLSKAVRDGLSSVRLIHGRGTGALRQAVREHLTGHSLARSFAPETADRGGNGVTAVDLV